MFAGFHAKPRRIYLRGREAGFSLVELLVVIAVVMLLAGILLPSLTRTKDLARLAVCRQNQRVLLAGLQTRAVEHDRTLPPFMFSSPLQPDLPLSGHWGGTTHNLDPALRYTRYKQQAGNINLQAVVSGRYAPGEALLCPATKQAFNETTSYFPYTRQFSTYCLRFPPSEDLFSQAQPIMNVSGMLLGIYRRRPGGTTGGPGSVGYPVPLVRLNRTYRVDGRVYHPAADALLADAFWMRDLTVPAEGDEPYATHRPGCHGEIFNVAFGDGSVRQYTDDGQVASLGCTPGQPAPDSGDAHGQRAEEIWNRFDDATRP